MYAGNWFCTYYVDSYLNCRQVLAVEELVLSTSQIQEIFLFCISKVCQEMARKKGRVRETFEDGELNPYS